MIKGLILFADGFEETEGIATHDILIRAGIDAVTASINNKQVITSMGLAVIADIILKEANLSVYDFIVIPGGKKGVVNLKASKDVIDAIKYFHDNDKLVCAICAGPSILGDLGYLDGIPFTCFPGFETGKGIKDNKNGVVLSGKIITARSMYFTIPFAEKIVEYYFGQEGLDKIYHGTRGADLQK
jgi:4-methyl-5(b-hydroxyethyl)-thiazole monophosphate biosynthesis